MQHIYNPGKILMSTRHFKQGKLFSDLGILHLFHMQKCAETKLSRFLKVKLLKNMVVSPYWMFYKLCQFQFHYCCCFLFSILNYLDLQLQIVFSFLCCRRKIASFPNFLQIFMSSSKPC